jgi:rare lipoprotein A (peptidoglycan hydrolase)
VDTWENLIGAVVEGRFRLRALTYSGRDQAEYLADATESQPSGDPLTVTLIAAGPDEIDTVRTQLLIASRLQHPNLVRIHGAGESAIDGQFMLYLASETPDQTLAAALANGPLPKDAVRGLALHILGALSFLHDEGLVYRALDPTTTVRVNGRWKLADYGQVCPAGDSSPEPPSYESPYLPPEAKTGPVLPAWDIWAFGILLRQALTGQVGKVRRLPRPFEDIVEGCLQPRPEQRLSVQQIRRMLEPQSEALPPEPAPAAAPQPEPQQYAATARTHFPKMPSTGSIWRSLRVLALIALACLAVLLPFGWRKKAPVAPAPPPAAPKAVPRPAAVAAPKQSAQAAKPAIAKADYISPRRNGRRTASGERFDSNALTAATRAYPMGTRLRVTNLSNSKSVIVRVNDRGGRGRIGLTQRAAREVGITQSGAAQVMLEVVKNQ